MYSSTASTVLVLAILLSAVLGLGSVLDIKVLGLGRYFSQVLLSFC